MRLTLRAIAIVVATAVMTPNPSSAQTPPAPAAPAPPPATKLEAFHPAAGTVVTLGYDELGTVSGVAVDVREYKGADGSSVRGVLVDVTESQYREERAFVDADEVAELLRGFDALLEIQGNPTPFMQFEVQYHTKGDLQLTAFNDRNNEIQFAVRAGRVTHATRYLNPKDMAKLKGIFAAAQQRLTSGAKD